MEINVNATHGQQSDDSTYTFTVWAGYMIVCLYYVIMVVILVKMFIAMISSTYKSTEVSLPTTDSYAQTSTGHVYKAGI